MTTEIHQPGEYCGERRDELIEYVFGEMGPGAAEAFTAHLDSCPGCRREAEALASTIEAVQDASDAGAEASSNGHAGAAVSAVNLEEEWALLRRRLRFQEELEAGPGAEALPVWRRAWIPAAAAVAVTAVLSFSAGYVWRSAHDGPVAGGEIARGPDGEQHPGDPSQAAPPVSGAGNYFDHIQDFSRDTHNFLRRSRMLLMEFTNLGADADPTFFRDAAGRLLAEAQQYQAVASRMENRKLGELLDQIAGILSAMAHVERGNQLQVVGDVKATLQLTDLVTALELLDAAVERELEGQPNV